ncbi:hypothetical protein BESB_062890 [Besnoitia besnoiti]|uniref:START domain-containing protein n=1 Tax=Besnoitia besnoiti TaxID=94643 RepID=A0A2A9MJ46_BESBE|nr:hypothetical protein BESB_062890 [Besnoitia besnoiti]PFH35402.1 hypothetical protein BESB_062890 [Besnoitia besnoiti]
MQQQQLKSLQDLHHIQEVELQRQQEELVQQQQRQEKLLVAQRRQRGAVASRGQAHSAASLMASAGAQARVPVHARADTSSLHVRNDEGDRKPPAAAHSSPLSPLAHGEGPMPHPVFSQGAAAVPGSPCGADSRDSPSRLLLVLRCADADGVGDARELLGSGDVVRLRLQHYLVNKLRGHPVLRLVSETDATRRGAENTSFAGRLKSAVFGEAPQDRARRKFVVVTADAEKLLLVLEEVGGLKLTRNGVFFAPYRSACRSLFKGGRKDSRLFLTPNEAVELMRSELFAMRFGSDAPFQSLQGLSVLEVCIAAGVVEDFLPLHQPRLLSALQAMAPCGCGRNSGALCLRRRGCGHNACSSTQSGLCASAAATFAPYDVLVAAYFGYPAAAFSLFVRWLRRLLFFLLSFCVATTLFHHLVPSLRRRLASAAAEAVPGTVALQAAAGIFGAGESGVSAVAAAAGAALAATVAAVAGGVEMLLRLVDSSAAVRGATGIVICLVTIFKLRGLGTTLPLFRYTLGVSSLPPFSFASSSSSLSSTSPFSALLFFEWPTRLLRQKIESLLAFAASPSEGLSYASHPLFRRAFLKETSGSMLGLGAGLSTPHGTIHHADPWSASSVTGRGGEPVSFRREAPEEGIEIRENADPIFTSRRRSSSWSTSSVAKLGLYACLYLLLVCLCLVGLDVTRLLPMPPLGLWSRTILQRLLSPFPLLQWPTFAALPAASFSACQAVQAVDPPAAVALSQPWSPTPPPSSSWHFFTAAFHSPLLGAWAVNEGLRLFCGLAEGHVISLLVVLLCAFRALATISCFLGRQLVGIRLPLTASLGEEAACIDDEEEDRQHVAVRQPDAAIQLYVELASLFFSVFSLSVLLGISSALQVALSSSLLVLTCAIVLDSVLSLAFYRRGRGGSSSMSCHAIPSSSSHTAQLQASRRPYFFTPLYLYASVLLLTLPIAALNGILLPFLVLTLLACGLLSLRAHRGLLSSRRSFSGSGKSFTDFLDLWVPAWGNQLTLLLVAIASSALFSTPPFRAITTASRRGMDHPAAALAHSSAADGINNEFIQFMLPAWLLAIQQAAVLGAVLFFLSWSVPSTTPKLRLVLEMAERELSAHEFGFAVQRKETEEPAPLTCHLVGLPKVPATPPVPFFTRCRRFFSPPLLVLCPSAVRRRSRVGCPTPPSLFEGAALQKMTLEVFGVVARAEMKGDEDVSGKSEDVLPHVNIRQLSAATDQFIASLPRGPGSVLTTPSQPSSVAVAASKERAEDTKRRVNHFLGEWLFNRSKSESMSPLTQHLGIPWVVRQAVEKFTPQLTYTYEAEKNELAIATTLTAGLTKTIRLNLSGLGVEQSDQDAGGAWKSSTRLEGSILKTVQRNDSQSATLYETRRVINDSGNPDDHSKDQLWYTAQLHKDNLAEDVVVNRYFDRVNGPPALEGTDFPYLADEQPGSGQAEDVYGGQESHGISTEGGSTRTSAHGRTGRGSRPDKDDKLEKMGEEAVDAVKDVVDSALRSDASKAGWSVTSGKAGSKIFLRDDGGDKKLPLVGLSVITMKAGISLKDVVDYLTDPASKLQFDPQTLKAVKLEELSCGSRILYQAFKGQWGFAGRDFLLLSRRKEISDKRVVIGFRSIEYSQAPPAAELWPAGAGEFVRATLLRGGYDLQVLSDGVVQVSFVLQADLKTDAVPAWISKRVKSDQLNIVTAIKNHIEKRYG